MKIRLTYFLEYLLVFISTFEYNVSDVYIHDTY